MDNFTKAYIECALWSSTDIEGEPLDALYSIDDIESDTIKQMTKECADFQECNKDALTQAYNVAGYSEDMAGHDFWLTRNRHGAGFWDRGLQQVGAELTRFAHAYGSVDLIVGEDGKVYR